MRRIVKEDENTRIWSEHFQYSCSYTHNRLPLCDPVPIFGLFTWFGMDTMLFWFVEEYIRTKVNRHTNDEYELFTHIHTSKCV